MSSSSPEEFQRWLAEERAAHPELDIVPPSKAGSHLWEASGVGLELTVYPDRHALEDDLSGRFPVKDLIITIPCHWPRCRMPGDWCDEGRNCNGLQTRAGRQVPGYRARAVRPPHPVFPHRGVARFQDPDPRGVR